MVSFAIQKIKRNRKFTVRFVNIRIIVDLRVLVARKLGRVLV